jgi:hypothetical protein
MRRIEKPIYDPCVVFSLCVGGIHDPAMQSRLNSLIPYYSMIASEYAALAASTNLFVIGKHVGKDESIVFEDVTRGELRNLYKQQMVGKDKPGRKIYEQLRALSKGRPCPYCGVGLTTTLDHYLPNAKYPFYSVLPINLIPSCKDCNTGKLASSASTAEEQHINPYYDKQHFFVDQWLFADVDQTDPAIVKFCVRPPKSWDGDSVSKKRVEAHFNDFSLSDRFSIAVAEQLSILRYDLAHLGDATSRKEELVRHANCCALVHKNSWQTALHQALAESNWYCQGGYAQG